MTTREVTVNVFDYLDKDELREAARQAAKEYFSCEIRQSNLPYRVFREAIESEGFDFKEAVLHKINQFKDDSSVYHLISSDEFKKQMASILKEERDLLRDAIVAKINSLDAFDLQQRIGEAILDVITRSAKP